MRTVSCYAFLICLCVGVYECSYPLKFQDYGTYNICISTNHKCDSNYNLIPENSYKRPNKEHILKKLTIFPYDIFTNIHNVSLRCQQQYKIHLDGAVKGLLNSLRLFDASAKLPAGLLSGNINQYGDFDECMEVVNAQYCLVLIDLEPLWKRSSSQYKNLVHSYFSIKETFDDPGHRIPGFTFARWGFCIPTSCTSKDLTNALSIKLGVKAKVRPNMCQAINGSSGELSYGHYFTWVYFVVIFAAVLIGTVLYRNYPNDQLSANIYVQFLTAFAVQRNYKQLTVLSKNKDEYRSLHGVRCLSAISLLMAHKTMASLYNPYINKTWMAEVQAMKWSVLGRNAIIYTDCFLLISGLLNANALFAELEKRRKTYFINKLVNRLIRILPGMVTVILYCTYILPFSGSGPLWPIVVNHHSELCKKNMWKNLLFIHNYFGFDNMCLTHTHQIGIDMQLFLVTPIFVYVMWKHQRTGFWIVGATAIISMCLRFYNTFYYNLSHVVHFGIPISRMFDTADYSYILPTHRATIYLIGLVLAYFLRGFKKVSFSKKKLFYIWASVYAVGLTTWFAPITMSIKGFDYNNFEAALYAAVYPFTWGVSIAWIIYAVEKGFGSWFTSILTWKYFQIFTRIAYGVYLIQFPVFFYNVGNTRHVVEYKHYMMLPPVETTFIILLATLLTIFVEMPFQNMYKLVASRYKT